MLLPVKENMTLSDCTSGVIRLVLAIASSNNTITPSRRAPFTHTCIDRPEEKNTPAGDTQLTVVMKVVEAAVACPRTSLVSCSLSIHDTVRYLFNLVKLTNNRFNNNGIVFLFGF